MAKLRVSFTNYIESSKDMVIMCYDDSMTFKGRGHTIDTGELALSRGEFKYDDVSKRCWSVIDLVDWLHKKLETRIIITDSVFTFEAEWKEYPEGIYAGVDISIR